MERKLSTPLYVAAFLLTVAVFSIGVYVGYLIDTANQDAISQEVEDISRKVESTQLLMLLDDNSSSFCPVFREQLDSINQEVERIGYKLSYLEEEKNAYDIPLKKSYFVLEAQSYLLSKKINERCGENDTLLLYFYSNTNCSDCKQQGYDILNVRDDFAKKGIVIKIFSFDGDIGSPVADALKSQFGISTYPGIVINGVPKEGYLNQSALSSMILGEENSTIS